MKDVVLFDRDHVAATWLLAFAIFLVGDGAYLTVARHPRIGLYSALQPNNRWHVCFVLYLILAASVVTIVDGDAIVGAGLGFTTFATYNLTTLATTDYDLRSAVCDLIYGTAIYAVAFGAVEQID